MAVWGIISHMKSPKSPHRYLEKGFSVTKTASENASLLTELHATPISKLGRDARGTCRRTDS